jgi:hypothetical protein
MVVSQIERLCKCALKRAEAGALLPPVNGAGFRA